MDESLLATGMNDTDGDDDDDTSQDEEEMKNNESSLQRLKRDFYNKSKQLKNALSSMHNNDTGGSGSLSEDGDSDPHQINSLRQ